MIKRTLYFGNPAYLKTKDEQFVFESTDTFACHPEARGICQINCTKAKFPIQMTNQPL